MEKQDQWLKALGNIILNNFFSKISLIIDNICTEAFMFW